MKPHLLLLLAFSLFAQPDLSILEPTAVQGVGRVLAQQRAGGFSKLVFVETSPSGALDLQLPARWANQMFPEISPFTKMSMSRATSRPPYAGLTLRSEERVVCEW